MLKDKSVKPLDMYQQDEDDDLEIEREEINENPNFDFDVDDLNDEEAENADDNIFDEDFKLRVEQDLLFLTQGVGSIKNINNYDVYVKHPQCEYSLKDIVKRLKTESEKYPIFKLTLGAWNFVQKDLLPLLIFHK